jgi:flavin-dependent dehydrogenase
LAFAAAGDAAAAGLHETAREAENDMMHNDVLIIGAGPTGLVLALWLTKLGVKVRIIDKTAEPGTTSRALALHARTLELYRQLDLADFIIEHGHKVPAVNLWLRGEPEARLPFETVGEDRTAYPFLEIFPQDEHERLLIEQLEKLGVAVERRNRTDPLYREWRWRHRPSPRSGWTRGVRGHVYRCLRRRAGARDPWHGL